MGRRIRSILDILLPTNKDVEYKQEKRNRYNPGDAVFAKYFRNNQNWLEGRIEEMHNSIVWAVLGKVPFLALSVPVLLMLSVLVPVPFNLSVPVPVSVTFNIIRSRSRSFYITRYRSRSRSRSFDM